LAVEVFLPRGLKGSAVTARGTEGLPEFADPPVDETALSVQFAPIPNFGVPHFGLYWQRIREDFPKFEVHPALPNVAELFSESVPRQRALGIQLVREPDVRCWFLDHEGVRLIQLQRDRLIHNWRHRTGKETYPRYPSVRATLEAQWKILLALLRDEQLNSPVINQCEVTYVNHIEYEQGWAGYSELNKVIAGWSGATSGQFLPSLERANIEAHYRLPNDLGRLHIAVEPVLRGRDSREVLQLTLTARGAPKSPNTEHAFEWLDLGREWVVKGFTDFTTESMHAIWGRRR
jgi:uncharacterized protein (TIGR04255 family)